MSTDPVAVLVLGAAGVLAGALTPVLVRLLPEPAPDREPETEADVAARERRAAMPTLELWGMRPDDGTKETYAAIAALRPVQVGSAFAGGLLGALLGWLYGFAPVQVALLPIVPACLALAVIDWRTRLLPTRLVWPATLWVVLTAVVAWPAYDAGAELRNGLVGMAVAWSLYWLMWFFLGIGYGDVRLSALVGFVLGWVGAAEWLLGLWAGTVLFAVPGVLVALGKRDRRYLKAGFPFGPFMLLGLVVGLVAGDAVIGGLVFRGA